MTVGGASRGAYVPCSTHARQAAGQALPNGYPVMSWSIQVRVTDGYPGR